MKVRIYLPDVKKYKNAPAGKKDYKTGYVVRDSYDGWFYAVDMETLLGSENLGTCFPIYWTSDSDILALHREVTSDGRLAGELNG